MEAAAASGVYCSRAWRTISTPAFELRLDGAVDSQALEFDYILLAQGSGNHRDFRVEASGAVHREMDGGLVGHGKEQDARGVDMGGLQDLVPGDVAPNAREPIWRESAVDGMVDLDYHKRNAGALKDARGRVSAAAVAGNDDVVTVRFGEWLHRR